MLDLANWVVSSPGGSPSKGISHPPIKVGLAWGEDVTYIGQSGKDGTSLSVNGAFLMSDLGPSIMPRK
jgi:hypothetical protein